MIQVRMSRFDYKFPQHGEGEMPGDRLDTTRSDVGSTEHEAWTKISKTIYLGLRDSQSTQDHPGWASLHAARVLQE